MQLEKQGMRELSIFSYSKLYSSSRPPPATTPVDRSAVNRGEKKPFTPAVKLVSPILSPAKPLRRGPTEKKTPRGFPGKSGNPDHDGGLFRARRPQPAGFQYHHRSYVHTSPSARA